MTVKELIVQLLDFDMNDNVSIIINRNCGDDCLMQRFEIHLEDVGWIIIEGNEE